MISHLRKKLTDVFQPEEGGIGRLARHSQGAAEVSLRSEHGRFDFRLGSEPEIWEPYVRTLARRQKPVFVVLWLEDDRPSRDVTVRLPILARDDPT